MPRSDNVIRMVDRRPQRARPIAPVSLDRLYTGEALRSPLLSVDLDKQIQRRRSRRLKAVAIFCYATMAWALFYFIAQLVRGLIQGTL